jgi:hypothetical protein
MTSRNDISIVTKRPFGRASQWKNLPQCEFGKTPAQLGINGLDIHTYVNGDVLLKNEIELLKRYQHFAEYFEIETYIDKVIAALRTLPEMFAKAVLTGRTALGALIRIV